MKFRRKMNNRLSPLEVLEMAEKSAQEEFDNAEANGDTELRERMRDLRFDIRKVIRLLESKFYENQNVKSIQKCLIFIGSTISFLAIWYIIIRLIFG